MTAAMVAIALVVVLAIVGPLVLYALVRAEHDDRDRMDRADAERVARRDTRERE